MQKDRILKKTGIHFIGNLSTKVLSACIVFLYAFYVGANDFGEYEYVQTLVNIIVPVFFFSIWDAILKFMLAEQNEENKRKITTTCTVFSLVSSLVIILVIGGYYLIINTGEKYAIYILLTYILNGIMWVWQHFLRVAEKNKIYVKSSLVGVTVNLIIALLLILFLDLGLEALFIANILGILSTFLTIEIELKILHSIKKQDIDLKILKRILKYSLPLVINVIPLWILNGLAKVAIQNTLGAEENGIYSFASKFTIVITFAGTILNTVLTEEMLILGKKGLDKEFSKLIDKLVTICLLVIICALPLITIFYEFIQNTEYYISKNIVPLLLVFAVFMNISNNISMVFKVHGKTKYQLIANGIGAAITAILMIPLIQVKGIMGAAIAGLAGATTTMIAMCILAKKCSNIKLNWKKYGLLMIAYIFLSVVLYS